MYGNVGRNQLKKRAVRVRHFRMAGRHARMSKGASGDRKNSRDRKLEKTAWHVAG